MKTKGESLLQTIDERIPQIVSLYYEFYQLKQLFRQGWLKAGVPEARCETVAEHSLGVVWLTAMLVNRMAEEKIDALKTLKMALIHDFGEIHAGDLTPQDQVSAQEKHHLEYESVRNVFQHFPEGGEFIALWEEYEAGESAEARFVKQIDRLEMGFQASVYSRLGLLAEPQPFLDSVKRDVTAPALVGITEMIEQLMENTG